MSGTTRQRSGNPIIFTTRLRIATALPQAFSVESSKQGEQEKQKKNDKKLPAAVVESFFLLPLPTKKRDMTTHPLDKFRFCPCCGSEHFEVNNVKSKHCSDCGFTYYANPSSATAAFIIRGGELLVARRGKEPAKGTLDLPGGFVDMDETAEEGMSREILEETGLTAVRMDYLFSIPNLYEYSGMTIHTIDMFYSVEVDDDGVPHAGDDAAELFWLPISEVRPEQFGLWSIRQAVARFLGEDTALD